jgi:hypothetical protein
VRGIIELLLVVLIAAIALSACGANHHDIRAAATVRPCAVSLPPDGKTASLPPVSAGSQVTDLSFTDNGDGTLALQWHLRNLGDYNQDGAVNVSDVTPIAMHYGENVPPGDDNLLLSVINGGGGATIGVDDITPIAMNFGNELAGYVVQFADAPDATTWADLQQVPLSTATGSGRMLFQVNITHSGEGYYAVTPYDSADNRGIRSTPVNYTAEGGWQTVTLDSLGLLGTFTSLAVVDGNPAVAYCDYTNRDLKYVRASNPGGTAWDTPVTPDSVGDVGVYASLAVVNGNPAISYYDQTNQELKYIHANDINGTTWGAPVTVDTDGNVGMYTFLAVVNGNPAISYVDYTNGYLKYIRAIDANGNAWGTPVTPDPAAGVNFTCPLVVVNGCPAIAYYDAGGLRLDLKYVRATDANGTTWGAPVTPDSVGDVGAQPSLVVVNGNPAISYNDAFNGDLKYVRADDANGTTWGAPVTPDSDGLTGYYSSMAIINGNPAISYFDPLKGLRYVEASDANGTTWGAPVAVDDTGDVGYNNCLVLVNGNPAISYDDDTNSELKYAYFLP